MSTVRRLKPVKNPSIDEPVQLEQEFAQVLRLKDELERKNHLLDQRVFELGTLLQAGKSLSRIRHLNEMIETLEAMITERFSVSRAWIWLKTGDDESLLWMNTGQSNLDNASLECLPDRGWFWQMVREGKSFSICDLSGRARFPNVFQKLDWEQFHASTCVPLIQAGQLFGVILLGATKTELNYDERTFLEEFAAIATLNLDLILQYERNQIMLIKALTDRMTGLWNNRCFEEDVEKRIQEAASQGTALSLVVSDIDHFKKFNDTHGHAAGDVVLKATAQLYRDWIAVNCKAGKVYRYGGEEFVILLPGLEAKDAFSIVDSLRKKLEEMDVLYEGKTLKVTASLGIAEYPAAAIDADHLFKAADQALYVAKNGGRNQVVLSELRLDPNFLRSK